ncbi:MAG: HD domain-containing protein [Clostridia bacterium]|nr:HD domain-containing protein [Clostridia bacterium]
MNFNTIDDNGRVEGFCLVKSVEKKTSSKGDVYLDFTLSDASGEMNAKLWRYIPAEHGEYKAQDIVKVRGTVSAYNGADQLRIERIRTAYEGDNVNIGDLVRSVSYSGEQMFEELFSIADGFEDGELKKIVTAILGDSKEKLLYWPAAYKLHHAVRGGLLMHTLSIVRLCERVCEIYPFVDRQLLISGAILHDVAKLDEFSVGELGIAEGYTVEGNLLGHLAMGAAKVDEYAKKLGISRKTSVLLQHMILSHHGDPEFGAAVRPMFIEAEILSELDLLDSRIYEMREAVGSVKADEFSGRMWALNDRKLYNHNRKDLDEDIKLF